MISANVNPHIYKMIADMLKNGPNGMILSFLVISNIGAIGNAMNVAKKILHTDIS